MQGAVLIDYALKFVENIQSLATGAHAHKRERYLGYINEGLAAEFGLDADGYSWMRDDGSVSISGNSGQLPADFREVGEGGTVWLGDRQLDYVPAWRMQQLQQTNSEHTDLQVYSIFGQEAVASDPADVRQLLQLPPGNSGATVTLRGYKKQIPTVIDATSASGLQNIPADFVEAVMKPYLRFRGYSDQNDQRMYLWEKRYEKALKLAKANDRQGKDTPEQFAGFTDEEGMW